MTSSPSPSPSPSRPSRASLYLRLGRVSNLPTVWTNVLAGAALGGGVISPLTIVPTALAMSSFYVGGMFLNDAFDRKIDAIERAERPIPAGHISATEVFVVGFGWLAAGMAMLAAIARFGGGSSKAIVTGLLLAGAIVLYDLWHKKNPLSPFLMGICRVLVYLSAALATGGSLSAATTAGAAMLLSYLIGLTYVAKQENLAEVRNLWPLLFLAGPVLYVMRTLQPTSVLALVALLSAWSIRAVRLLRTRAPGSIPRAVASLIAGISLVDAVLIAGNGGSIALAAVCALGMPVTLLFHRSIAGT